MERDRETVKPPSLFLLALEGRALWELATTYATSPILDRGPQGDGHPVMVLPGFVASGISTRPLRKFLQRNGWRSHCWKLGRNFGLDPHLEAELIERLRQLHRRYRRKVSLVGWSLGGVYCRWLANHKPEWVRCVISLGSPFNDDHRANHAWRLFEQLSGQTLDQIDPETYRMVRENPPVPTTAIYSCGDGITAWPTCVLEESEIAENIRVPGSHLGLGVNPLALHAIADRLAQPEGSWRRFERSGTRRFLYPEPVGRSRLRQPGRPDAVFPTDFPTST
ncbi:MAG: alpha/beta hydrolase [Thermoanaerobaculia bacterium]|nr:alpha/beta hydrolase [Thermoanaerobaculia bacterium]